MKQFESFRLDTVNECLWREGAQISLPPRPFMVLRYLVENPGRLITHDELLDKLWPETFVQPQVLRTYMLELRKLLGDDAGQPRFIQTVPKRGYCFVAPVSDWDGHSRGTTRRAPAHDAKLAGFVDRVDELERLNAQLQFALGGQRRVVFVTGEAGIGKTALADAFCAGQASVARGQCVKGFAGKEEYYPVMEALSQLCASPDGDLACRTLSRMAPAWLGALGREPVPAATPLEGRMPGDLCGAIEAMAADRPLVLVFEDLHWADDSTLNLISALAQRRAPAKLMVVGTYAPQRLTPEHAVKSLKQDLLMRQLCTEIALAPFHKGAVRELLAAKLQQETLPQGLASFVHQHSEGNPLFAIAILEHLTAQRYLVTVEKENAARWELRGSLQEMDAHVPDRLAQMIELEIERLSAADQRLLEAGSVAGIAFPAWAVAAALEDDVAATEEACDGLARKLYFLERAGEDELPDGTRSEFYVFVHGLYREVLYQRQSATRRATRHTRIAQRLGELFAGREASVAREMAMHYEAAANWRLAASSLRAAARHAVKRQAHAEAAELLQRALRLAENIDGQASAPELREIRSELASVREPLTDGAAKKKKPSEKS